MFGAVCRLCTRQAADILLESSFKHENSCLEKQSRRILLEVTSFCRGLCLFVSTSTRAPLDTCAEPVVTALVEAKIVHGVEHPHHILVSVIRVLPTKQQVFVFRSARLVEEQQFVIAVLHCVLDRL